MAKFILQRKKHAINSCLFASFSGSALLLVLKKKNYIGKLHEYTRSRKYLRLFYHIRGLYCFHLMRKYCVLVRTYFFTPSFAALDRRIIVEYTYDDFL